MAINKVPNNYYNDTNIRRDKINTIIDHVNELDTHPVVPTPAAGDVGKVVKVGSDGYELASDAGAKLVVATVTTDGQGNLSCDKTYAELSASIANGDIVELSYLYQTFVFSGIDLAGIYFGMARNDSNGHNVITAWTISSSNVITFNIEGINTELPTVTSADAGKVLGVDNNGAWGLKDDINVFTYTTDSTGIILPNIADIVSLINNGKCPIIKSHSEYGDSYYHIVRCTPDDLIGVRFQFATNFITFSSITFDVNTGRGVLTSRTVNT